MSNKAQFNIEVPAVIASRLRADARRSGRSLSDVATTIFEDFLKGWTVEERERFYKQSKAKILGRPVKLSSNPKPEVAS